MSEHPVPAYVDTRKVFQQEAEISGPVALERLPRFRQGLISDNASISVTLAFSRNRSGQQLISGSLSGTVEVQCQRCLEPVTIKLRDDIRLALVPDEAAAGRLEAELDPWICEEFKLALAPLVEEQLLLCMPIVSYHDDAHCSGKLDWQAPSEAASSENAQARPDNPFAILKSLKESD